jgi:hypothetical protein
MNRYVLMSIQLYRSYFSTRVPRPFKQWKWHNEKKHRHHRHLSLLLLLRGLLVTSDREARQPRMESVDDKDTECQSRLDSTFRCVVYLGL